MLEHSSDDQQQEPRSPPSPSNTIYIGNLPRETSKDELANFLKEYGNITSIRLTIPKKENFNAYGFVRFEEQDAADEARGLSGTKYKGNEVVVEYRRKTTKKKKPTKNNNTGGSGRNQGGNGKNQGGKNQGGSGRNQGGSGRSQGGKGGNDKGGKGGRNQGGKGGNDKGGRNQGSGRNQGGKNQGGKGGNDKGGRNQGGKGGNDKGGKGGKGNAKGGKGNTKGGKRTKPNTSIKQLGADNFRMKESETAVIVQNLPLKMSDLDLLLLFSETVGQVVSCHIEKREGQSVGHVEFANPDHQKEAVKEFDNQLIELGNPDSEDDHEEVRLTVKVAEIAVLVERPKEEETK